MKKFFALLLPLLLAVTALAVACEDAEYSLSLTAEGGIDKVAPGGSVQLSTEITGEADDAQLLYVLKTGEQYAAVSEGGLLTVSAQTPIDTEIEVYSKLSNVRSNTLTFTVTAIPAESIVISANKQVVDAGGFAVLSYQLLPADTTETDVQWTVTEGADYAYVSGGRLFVNEDAPAAAAIKLTAGVGSVTSNELEFTVSTPPAATYILDVLSGNSITLDYNGLSQPVLEVEVTSIEGTVVRDVTDATIVYELLSGDEFVRLQPDGYQCSFELLGHGSAQLRVSVQGTSAAKTIEINTVKPPEQLLLPEVFRTRPGFTYSFSRADNLPFAVTPVGEKVSGEVRYSFEYWDGGKYLSDALSGYSQEQGIAFGRTGQIRVTATSQSGSRVETSASYVFDVNDGINVYTWEDFKALSIDSTVEGTAPEQTPDYAFKPINFTVMEKPHENFGYDLVPGFIVDALSGTGTQTVADVYGTYVHLWGSVTINGNRHKIDLSRMKAFPAERPEGSGGKDNIGSLIQIHKRDSHYNINISNLEIVGNSGLNFSDRDNPDEDLYEHRSKGYPRNTHARALKIGLDSDRDYYNTTNISNFKINGFTEGMLINHAVDSKLKNVEIADIFATGITMVASQVIVEDIYFGLCGAFGIELSSDEIDENGNAFAGKLFNEHQKIEFRGNLISTNLNNGQTVYMQNYKAIDLPTAIKAIITGYLTQVPEQLRAGLLSNIQNIGNNDMNYLVLIGQDPLTPTSGGYGNRADTVYGMDSGGHISLEELIMGALANPEKAVNTTHRYISFKLDINQGPYYSGGRVLLVNLNYQGS